MSDYLDLRQIRLYLREAAIIIGAVLKANADVALVTGPPATGIEAARARITSESADFIGKFKAAYRNLKDAVQEIENPPEGSGPSTRQL